MKESIFSLKIEKPRVRWWLAVAGLVVLTAAIVAINVRSPLPDSALGLDVAPGRFLAEIFHTWSGVDLGQRVRINGASFAYLPVAVLYAVLHGLGCSILFIQQLWFSLLIVASAIGMLILYRQWWDDQSVLRAFSAALLYAFSPYVLLDLKPASVLLIPYAGLPWLTYEVIKVIRFKRPRNVLVAAIIGGILVPGINPPLIVMMFFGVCVMALGELGRRGWHRDAVRWLAATAVAVAVGSAWWIGPFVNSLRASGANAYFITDPLTMDAASSSFHEVLRLTGLWALYQGWDGIPYYGSQGYLLTPLIIFLTFLAPVAVLLSVRQLWPDIRAKTLLVIMVVTVPLAVSIYPIGHTSLTAKVYLWLYHNVFAFREFRSNYKWVWLLAFAYALLIPVLSRRMDTYRNEGNRHSNISPLIGMALAACLMVAYIAPFIGGSVFPSNYRIGTVPGYWYRAAAWLNHQPSTGRVLFLPEQGFSVYNWGSPQGDLAQLLLHRQEITPEIDLVLSHQANELLAFVDDALANSSVPLQKILALLNVRYIVQRNDVNWHYYGSASPKQVRFFLRSQPFLTRVASFGRLDIYEVAKPSHFVHSLVGVASAVEPIVSDQGLSSSIAAWQVGTLARFGSVSLRNPIVRYWRSSSVFDGLTNEYGPQMVTSGNPSNAWVSNVPGGAGQWVQIGFTRRQPLGVVTIVVRHDGVDAFPRELIVSAEGRREMVTVNDAGIGRANLGEAVSSSLRVTIVSSGNGGPNVGISRISFRGLPVDHLAYPRLPVRGPARYLMEFAPLGSGAPVHIVLAGTTRKVTITGSIQGNPILSNEALATYLVPVGVTSVTASSRFDNLATYSPLWSIGGDPAMFWVSNVPGGVGQWLKFNFPVKRWVGVISLRARKDGVDAEATSVRLTDGNRFLGDKVLDWKKNGTAVVAVNRSISSLRITILSSQRGRPSRSVGFDVNIPGVAVIRHPSAINPSSLLMNGHSVLLHLGTHSAVPRGSEGRPLFSDALVTGLVSYQFSASEKLDRGKRYLWNNSPGLIAVSRATLAVGNSNEAKIRWISARQVNAGHFTARLPSRGGYLFLDESADPLWQAHVRGKALHEAGLANAYGKVWSFSGRAAQVSLSTNSGIQPLPWLVGWGATIFGIGAGLIIVRRRLRRSRLAEDHE